MMKLLRRMFPPLEVKATRTEISDFFKKNGGLVSSKIRNEIVDLAHDVEKTRYSIRIDGLKPEQLALILITNVVGRHISSGQHHIYRGVLGGSGQELLRIWHDALNDLRTKGYYSEHEVEQDKKWIQEQIRSVG